MGTDCYLKWKEQTENEKKKQITGFSIDAGNAGYLRASIGMQEENAVLRALFPDKYWEGKSITTVFDFKGNLVFALRCIVSYLKKEEMPEDVQKRTDAQKQQGDMVKAFLKKAGFDEVKDTALEDDRYRKIWAKSLYDFWMLGIKLQKAGKKPYIYISW